MSGFYTAFAQGNTMPRILNFALCVMCAGPPLSAQQLPELRFARVLNVQDTVPAVAMQHLMQEDERRPAPFGRQYLFGLAGTAVGVGAAIIHLKRSDSANDLSDMGPILVGAIAGSTIGVHWYSHTQGWSSNVGVTLLGSTLGMLGGPPTMPLGATIFYNKSRRDRRQP